jgi:hypothetical protein
MRTERTQVTALTGAVAVRDNVLVHPVVEFMVSVVSGVEIIALLELYHSIKTSTERTTVAALVYALNV